MPPLPIISADECIAALRRFGYQVARQKGSHVRLTCEGRTPVSVPTDTAHAHRSLALTPTARPC
jgi:predicted RNA binding protein YcfA (HicA-like mRNA interferase family)